MDLRFCIYDYGRKKMLYFDGIFNDFIPENCSKPMLFTGAFSANNEKIYENDIIVCEGVKVYVKYSEDICGFVLYEADTDNLFNDTSELGIYKKIGNRIANPELLA